LRRKIKSISRKGQAMTPTPKEGQLIEKIVEERYQEFIIEQGFETHAMTQILKDTLRKIFMGGFRKGMEYILNEIREESRP